MLSVRNCLLNPSKITSDICEEKTIEEIKKVHFISLPKMIDASHLDVKEDLLEVIIANMLKELVRVTSDREFDKRKFGQKVEELQLRLTKVQNDYDSLIQTNGHTIPASYNMLIQGADKHHIQSEFKSIIDDYLYILSDYRINKHSTEKHDKYLVICIDDIDMYPGDPMLIMQCIYRYFTLPNVLLLTSWNYGMLYQYIYKHYYRRMYLYNKVENANYSERERLCHDQSNDYLRKIVPFDKRIVMPSWRKSDYRDLIDKNISLYPKEEFDKNFKEQFPRLFPGRLYSTLSHKVNHGGNNILVKEFIFLMLADRTGVYLDASGYKPHFMEPDGLRSTFELFDSLYTMNNIRNDEGNANRYKVIGNDEKIKQNYKLLLDTFYFKLLPSLRLNDEESDFFNTIYREKLSRRSKAIIDYYYILLQRNKEEKKSFFDYENTIEDHCKHSEVSINQDYSIGELFRILHHSTRLGLFSKQLVKAILASYSFILPYYFDEGTFMYYEELKMIEEKRTDKKIQDIIFKGDKFNTLFGIFGGSLLGNWIYEMFGFKELHLELSIERLRNFKPKNYKKANADSYLYALLNILMFIRLDRLKELSELKFIKVLDTNNQNDYLLETEVDPTAFFINAIRFDEFSKEIERLTGGVLGNVIKTTKKRLYNYFICGDYKENLDEKDKERYPIFALPFHQVDIIYNVIKRSLKEIMYISDSELRIKSHRKSKETDDENKTIESFYQNIIKYLSRVKNSYPVYDESGVDRNIFVERFYKLGLEMNLWRSTEEGCQPEQFKPENEEYRMYGEYKIDPVFKNYCRFVTTEMLKKNNTDTMNSNKKTNDCVLLSELIDEIVGKNKCKSITKKQTEKKESPAKKR